MDIAEKIKEERAALFHLLRNSRANELLTENLPVDGLLFIGCLTQPKFYWVSHNWISLLNYDFKELTEKSYLEFVHPNDIKRTDRAFEHLQKTESLGFKGMFPNRYKKKNGSYALIGWYDFIVLDKDNDKFSIRAKELTQEEYDEAMKTVEYLRKE
jgi:hypothetical protein